MDDMDCKWPARCECFECLSEIEADRREQQMQGWLDWLDGDVYEPRNPSGYYHGGSNE